MAGSDVVEMVARADAICVSWNGQHAAARTSHQAPLPTGDLAGNASSLATVREAVGKVGLVPPRLRAARRIATWAAGAAVLGLAIFALLVPRPDVNAFTVASALQSQLGPGAVVECRPSAGEWNCTEYRLTGPLPCPVAGTSSAARDTSAPALVSAGPHCSRLSSSTTFAAEVDPGEVDAAILERTSQGAEIERLKAKLDNNTLVAKIWDKIIGRG